MSALNLHASDPILFVDRSTPSELLEAVRALEIWDEQALDMANLLITVWSSDAIARANDREGISELQRIIHFTLTRANALSSLPEEYRCRWQEASDMLEARRLNLAHADPEMQLNRTHVPEILQWLFSNGNRELPQSELVKHLEVTAGRVTQLIGPLESSGLVSKRKHGRDILLQLTDIGLKHASSASKIAAPVIGFSGLFSTKESTQSQLNSRIHNVSAA
jgi:DNA-binding MarR family transcriptional regulator